MNGDTLNVGNESISDVTTQKSLNIDPVLSFHNDEVVVVSQLPNDDRKMEPAVNGDTLNVGGGDISDDLDLDNLTTDQLLNVILINPEKYLVDEPPKGTRKNFIYTIKNASANDVNCDDNGAYTKFGSTRKSYYVERANDSITRVNSVHVRNKRFYYKERKDGVYVDRYVPDDDIFTVERTYRYNKSIPGLKHLKVRVKSEKSKQFEECMCVVYTLSSEIKATNKVEETGREEDEDVEILSILPHGGTKKHDKPYIRTSNKVFEEEDLLLGSSSNTTSDVYDKVTITRATCYTPGV